MHYLAFSLFNSSSSSFGNLFRLYIVTVIAVFYFYFLFLGVEGEAIGMGRDKDGGEKIEHKLSFAF